MKTQNSPELKYTIRKLMTFVVIGIMFSVPRIYSEVKNIVAPDPYHLLARSIEAFDDAVDVVGILDQNYPKEGTLEISEHLAVIVYIRDWNSWTARSQENLLIEVMELARSRQYKTLDLIIGWRGTRNADAVWTCTQLFRSGDCAYIPLTASTPLLDEYVMWPGIGNP